MSFGGSCLCGAVIFESPGRPGPVVACHCIQCRKLSGFYSASIDAPEGTVWTGEAQVTTHATPGGGVRGFCGTCGTKLWFRDKNGATSIEAGLLDQPTGTRLVEHIFMADKGDYYTIADGLPQFDQWGQI